MRTTSKLLNGRQLRWIVWLPLVFAIAIQGACATGPRPINHTFEFDARVDSQDVEIIDYRYGDSNVPGVRGCPAQYFPCERSRQYAGTTGKMPLGDELYVKWRIKSTGKVYEDTVDLKNRLPDDITNNRIRFVIKGAQLYVYLITPVKLIPNPCPSRDRRHQLDISEIQDNRICSLYCSTKTIRLYPGQPEPLNIK